MGNSLTEAELPLLKIESITLVKGACKKIEQFVQKGTYACNHSSETCTKAMGYEGC